MCLFFKLYSSDSDLDFMVPRGRFVLTNSTLYSTYRDKRVAHTHTHIKQIPSRHDDTLIEVNMVTESGS